MQDLSHMISGAGVLANSSMSASNTVSVNPPFSGAGSPSEAYNEQVQINGHPELDLGAQQSLTKDVSAGTDAFAGHAWTSPDVSGNGWTAT